MPGFDTLPPGEPEYNDDTLDDVLEEMMCGCDFNYDGTPFSSTEIYRFIQRIRHVVEKTMAPKKAETQNDDKT